MIKIDKYMRCEGGFFSQCNKPSEYFYYTYYWNRIIYLCRKHRDNAEARNYPYIDFELSEKVMNEINSKYLEFENNLNKEIYEIIDRENAHNKDKEGKNE